MTENQWTREGSYTAPPASGQQFDTGSPVSRSTKDTVTEEAAGVAHEAAHAAQGVAETAKQEAANVAAEVKYNARELFDQARSDLTEQAGYQQQKVAAGLRSIADELRTMADASQEPGVATDLVRQAAERSSAAASWLDGRDPGSLLDEVKSFARQRPGAFLAIAAGAGILAGRLSRGLAAGPPPAPGRAAGGAVPPPPVRLPAPEMTTAGMQTAGAPTSGTAAAGAALAGAATAGMTSPDRTTEASLEDAPLDEPAAYRTTGPIGSQAPQGVGEVPPVEEPYSDDPDSGGKYR